MLKENYSEEAPQKVSSEIVEVPMDEDFFDKKSDEIEERA